MYYSMVEHADTFTIFVFCMDDESCLRMSEKKLPSVVIVKYSELEEFDGELFESRSNRSRIEYYFTCTPAICNYVFANYNDVDLLTYLDSDLYFFSSPEVVFEEIGNKSIAIVEHRFSKFGRKFLKLGIFNVAWITFRRDKQGMQCLKKYRQQCLEWCCDYLDGDRYADQKYLDSWPLEYPDLIILKNKGVNLACWNIGNYKLKKNGTKIFVNDDELVFYHFAGFEQLRNGLYTSNMSSYFIRPGKLVKNEIYAVYITNLIANSTQTDISKKTINPKYSGFSLKRLLKDILRKIRLSLFGDYIKV